MSVLGRWIVTRAEHEAIVKRLKRERDAAVESWESWRDDADRTQRRLNVLSAWFAVLALVCGIGWGLFGGGLL